MTSPHLSALDEVITDYAAETMTHGETTAWLRAHGYAVNEPALAYAVDALRARDGLMGGSIDPLDWLDAAPRPGFDALAYAVAQVEDDYAWALQDMLPGSVARAS